MLERVVKVGPGGGEGGGTARPALQHFPCERLPERSPEDIRGWAFPAHLDNPTCRWLQALKHVYGQRITYPASLSPQAGELLHTLVLNTRPRVVVETGTFLGISTIWMAAALELAGEGAIHCIDDFRPIRKGRWRSEEMLEGRQELVREHLAMAGLDHRVIIHNANSAEGVAKVAQHLGGGPGGVQFAFLDADHSPEGVRREFQALEPVLDTGGYVVLHDIYPRLCKKHGPRELLDKVHTFASGRYECLDVYIAPTNFGLGVMRRIG